MPRLIRKMTPVIILLAAAMVAGGCSGDDKANQGPGKRGRPGGMMGAMGGGQKAVPVEVTSPFRAELASYVFGNANVEALRDVEVVARVQGLLQKMNVEEGDQVRRGQVLAELDKRELNIALAESQARLENTQAIYERSLEMLKQELTSREQVDQAEYNFKTASSQHDRATLNLDYASIKSPFKGIITQRLSERGDLIRANTVMFKLADTEKLWIRLFVPEKEMGRIDEGDRAVIQTEMFPDRTFSGEVEMVSPVVDPTTGTVKVTVRVTEGRDKLKPGMFCTLYILIETHENSLAITRKALIPETESPEVFVIDTADSTTIVHRRRLEVGIIQGDTLEILSGLSDGEQVVLVGHESLNENTAVRVVAAEGDSTLIASPPPEQPGMDKRRERMRKMAAEMGITLPDSGAVPDSIRQLIRNKWQQKRNNASGTQSQ